MEFDWDPDKRASNLEKHGIDVRRAVQVFEELQRIDEDATRPDFGENRRKTVGRVGQTMVCVISTDRHQVRRITSARRARKNERERYRQSAEFA